MLVLQVGRCESGNVDEKTLEILSGELSVLVDNGMLLRGGVVPAESSHHKYMQAHARLVQKGSDIRMGRAKNNFNEKIDCQRRSTLTVAR